METIIKNIKFIYNENQKDKIEAIKRTFDNNSELLSEIFEEIIGIDISKDEKVFDNLFYQKVRDTFKEDLIQEKLDNDSVLAPLYLKAICVKNNIKQEDDNLITAEILSTMIAYKYFQENVTFNDFVEYIKVRDKEEELFKWLGNKARWEALELLYSSTLDAIKYGEEKGIINIMKDITAIWLNRACEKVRSMNAPKESDIILSDKEFENLFYEFMNYINAPTEWIDTFNYLKENNLIVIEKSLDKRKGDQCFLDKDGQYKLLLLDMNSIEGFPIFIHEFIHYISMNKKLYLPKVLVIELPSIFYQYLADEFLLEKGLITEEEKSSNKRVLNNYLMCMSCAPKYREFFQYADTGKINKDEKVAECMKKMNTLAELKGKEIDLPNLDIFNLMVDFTPEEMANIECDMTIENALKNRLDLIEGIEYLIDTFIVEKILAKRKEDDSVLNKMIEITNNLKDVNIRSIINMFGLEISIENEAKQVSKKYYKEKKNEEIK